MLFPYIIILLGYVNLALSLDYDDFINNYRAIFRGTDAPEGSNVHVGRIQYNFTVPKSPTFNRSRIRVAYATGFFVIHKGPNEVEKPFFFTVAHPFNLNLTGTPTNEYIKPGRTSKISLLSKGTIKIFYGSVKKEEQKVFDVYPNGLYTTPVLGLAHIVRVPSAYSFDDTPENPNTDMAAIELTENQAHQFANDGGLFVKSKDDSPEKLFQAGEVCKIASWGVTNEDEESPLVWPTRLQQADIMAKDMDYCIDTLLDGEPLQQGINNTQFACFSTHFGTDNDPGLRGGDSGALITCGNGDGSVATIATHAGQFETFGPTRASLFAFVKDCFYD